jgi:hypothetical protein
LAIDAPLRNGPSVADCQVREDSDLRPKLKMSVIAAAFAMVAVLAVIGWARKPAPGTAYNSGAGYAWETNAEVVQANAPTAAPGTRAMYGDQQTEPHTEAPAASRCAQSVGDGYATPSYGSGYSVRKVRPRVIEERPRAYAERRVLRRGRSTGKSVAMVAAARASVRRLARWRRRWIGL